jgi:hypothetical protein
MADFEFDFYEAMPIPLKDLLEKLVQLSKKGKRLSIRCFSDGAGNKHYQVGPGNEFEVKALEFDFNANFSLEVLQLIKVRDIDGTLSNLTLFLTPKAFRWYEYHKANRIKKWWARTQNKTKNAIIGISFGLSILLTALQILGLTLPVLWQRMTTIIH